MSRQLNVIFLLITLILFMAGSAVHVSQSLQVSRITTCLGSQGSFGESLWTVGTWNPTTTFTMMLAVMAAGQAGLFYWQLGLIRKGAADTKDAANAARRSAETANAQLSLVERLERPWLLFEPPAFGRVGYTHGGDPDTFPSIDYNFQNHGRSPAIIERADIAMGISREPPLRIEGRPTPYFDIIGEWRNRIFYTSYFWNGDVVGPGDCLGKCDLPNLPLTEDQRRDLATGTQRLWLDGRMHYLDVFGKSRETQFRLVYDYSMDMFVRDGGKDFNWAT